MINKFKPVNHPGLKHLPMLDGGERYEPTYSGTSYLEHFASHSVLHEGHNVTAKIKRKGKVYKTMHEFKHGTLHSGSKRGPMVRSRKQAVAIALAQARKAGEDV